jgi:hypothetical protein
MMIIFFKSFDTRAPERKRSRTDGGDEALEKIRIIFQQRVDEAETAEDRERAERELEKLQA